MEVNSWRFKRGMATARTSELIATSDVNQLGYF